MPTTPTFTLTFPQDELFEVQLALEARHQMLRDRIRVLQETPAATFGGEDAKRRQIDEVRARDLYLSRAWSRVTHQESDSPALSEMLRDGRAGR